MSALKKLKFVEKTRSNMLVSPELKARAKFTENVDIQIAGAKAEIAGEPFIRRGKRWVTDEETQERVLKEVPLKFRKWWWTDEGGALMLSVKYGARKLEMEPGKPTIEVGDIKKLIAALETLREACAAGELDAAIAVARTRKPAVSRAS